MCRRWSSLRSVYTPQDAIFRLYFHFKHLCIVKNTKKDSNQNINLNLLSAHRVEAVGQVFSLHMRIGGGSTSEVRLVIFDLAIGYI